MRVGFFLLITSSTAWVYLNTELVVKQILEKSSSDYRQFT